MSEKFVTAKAIIIPEGTEVYVNPPGSARTIFTPFADITIGVTKDVTARWEMDLGEAIETGLVRAA